MNLEVKAAAWQRISSALNLPTGMHMVAKCNIKLTKKFENYFFMLINF